MVTSYDSSEKLDYLGGDDDDDDNDDSFHSSTLPLDHSKYTYLMAEERVEVFGPGEPSAQLSCFSLGETSF